LRVLWTLAANGQPRGVSEEEEERVFGIPSNDLAGVVLAAVPGVLVALFTQYLVQRTAANDLRRLTVNARAVLRLEVQSNLETLRSFWQTVNDLDDEHHPADSTKHLARMFYSGLTSYQSPAWAVVRWERLPAEAYAALSDKEIAVLDRLYRDLRSIATMYGQVANLSDLSANERQELEGDRFWYNRLADWRIGIYKRLNQAAERALATSNPLAERTA
jgi:hypothetical protein